MTWLAVGSLLLLTGCSSMNEHVPVEYRGTGGTATQSVPASEHVAVAVRVLDERAAYKRLTSKTDRYGDEAAPMPIYAANDVPQVVQDALEMELSKRGFAIAPGGAMVSVKLVRFRGEVRPRWSDGFDAEMILSVDVRRPDGLGVFSHTFTGDGAEIGIRSGSTAKVALDRALTAAIAATVNDKDFLGSLAPAGPTASN